jgi:hypothetical protein
VEEGNVIRFEYEEPFGSLFGSQKRSNCGGEGTRITPWQQLRKDRRGSPGAFQPISRPFEGPRRAIL